MTDEQQKTPGQIAYEVHQGEELNRIYPWEKIYREGVKESWEAAAEAVRAPLLERIAKLESRLEIDHVYVVDNDAGDGLVRVDVPPEERDDQIDGIDARDSTISLLKDRIAELEAQLVEFERMEGRELKRPK